MTTNFTHFMPDLGEVLAGDDATKVATGTPPRHAHSAGDRWLHNRGCGLGALYEAAAGLSSLALPTCLALLAFAMCLMRRRLAFRNTSG